MSFRSLGRVVGLDLMLNIVMFASAPLLLLFYPAEAVGHYSLLQSAAALGSVVATLRLEIKVRDKRPDEFLVVFNQLLVLALPLSILGITCVWAISFLYGKASHITLTYPIAIMASYFIGLSNFYNFLSVSQSRIAILNASRAIRVVSLIGMQFVFAILLHLADVYVLYASVLVSAFFSFIVNYAYYRQSVAYRQFSFPRTWRTLISNKELMIHHVPSALIVSFADAVLALWLVAKSPAYAGIFFIADRLLRTPVALLTTWLRQFILSGGLVINRYHLKWGFIVLVVSVVLTKMALWFLGPMLIKFSGVIGIFSILLIFYASQLFVSVHSSLAISKGHDSTSAIYAVLYACGTLFSFEVSNYFSPTEFHTVFASIMTACMLIQFLYVWFRMRNT